MWSFGFSGCFEVSSDGRSGGLALFWVHDCPVSLKHYNSNIIDVTIGSVPEHMWRASFVYGEPKVGLRHNLQFMGSSTFGTHRAVWTLDMCWRL